MDKQGKAKEIYEQNTKEHNKLSNNVEHETKKIADKNSQTEAYNSARLLYWEHQKKTLLGLQKKYIRLWEEDHSNWEEDHSNWESLRNSFSEIRKRLERTESSLDGEGISDWWRIIQLNGPYPECLPYNHSAHMDATSKILVFNLALPDFSDLSVVKDRELVGSTKVVPANKSETKRALKYLFFAYPLKVAYEIANSPMGAIFSDIVVNSMVTRADPATGHQRTDCVASVMIPVESIKSILINQIDPEAAFKSFRGSLGGPPEDLVQVVPVLSFSEDENRFVQGRDVVEHSQGSNLAAMNWEDFEHLVRELFEREFGETGAEVRVTKASRDKGVDAIVLDPDPIKGGKFIVQAKRYTNVVGVSAVRDLYGAVLNEGANRGILVSTSHYGRDAYEFAKDKPLTLLNGSELVRLLEKHGWKYFIDIDAARNILFGDS